MMVICLSMSGKSEDLKWVKIVRDNLFNTKMDLFCSSPDHAVASNPPHRPPPPPPLAMTAPSPTSKFRPIDRRCNIVFIFTADKWMWRGGGTRDMWIVTYIITDCVVAWYFCSFTIWTVWYYILKQTSAIQS